MKRTTILLDDALLIAAQALAEQRAMTFTALVGEAVRAYIRANRGPRTLSCIGIGHSDRPRRTIRDGGDEVELRAGIDAIEGWSPRRASDGAAGSARANRDSAVAPDARATTPAHDR